MKLAHFSLLFILVSLGSVTSASAQNRKGFGFALEVGTGLANWKGNDFLSTDLPNQTRLQGMDMHTLSVTRTGFNFRLNKIGVTLYGAGYYQESNEAIPNLNSEWAGAEGGLQIAYHILASKNLFIDPYVGVSNRSVELDYFVNPLPDLSTVLDGTQTDEDININYIERSVHLGTKVWFNLGNPAIKRNYFALGAYFDGQFSNPVDLEVEDQRIADSYDTYFNWNAGLMLQVNLSFFRYQAE